jgi:hypothetical protein
MPKTRSTAFRRPVFTLAGLLLLTCPLAGCGSDTTTAARPEGAATAGAASAVSSEACTDAAALKESVAELDRLDVPKAGKAGLQSSLQEIRTRLGDLKGSAGSHWGTQISQLDGAVQVFQTTVAGVNSDNVLNDVPAKIRNLEQIDQAWTTLEREIDRACPTA